jgi:hypothetical protein
MKHKIFSVQNSSSTFDIVYNIQIFIKQFTIINFSKFYDLSNADKYSYF